MSIAKFESRLKDLIILAAGGTGGHVFPAVALAEELEKRNYKVIFATDERGLKYLGKYGNSAIVQKTDTSSRARLYLDLVKNIFKSFFKLFRLKPKIVIGFGGYPSVPFVAAFQLRLGLTIIHEQNAVIGKANDLLSKMAYKIVTSFPKTIGIPIIRIENYIGNPTRFEKQYDSVKAPSNDVFTILIFGGSQGASIFSEKILDAICKLSEYEEIKVYHQGRKEDIAKIKSAYDKFNIENTTSDFFANIDELYKKSDLVISRSGASTIFEIIGFKKPSILIPYKNSINGDQEENAKFLEENNAAIVLREPQLNEEIIVGILRQLVDSPEKMKKMSDNLAELRQKDPAKKFADLIETILKPVS